MEKGAYIIHANPDIRYDIRFAIKPEVVEVPQNQQKLQLEIEKTLVVVRKLFADDEAEMQNYFTQLLTLAQAGMVPDNAQPIISLNALQQLKSEIIEKKSGEVKNAYFRLLGMQAIKIGAGPVVIALVIKGLNYFYPGHHVLQQLSIFSNFLYLWSASLVGVWISFATRKPVLTFEELITIEEDRLEPSLRLILVGIISMVFALLFYKEAITMTFGPVSSKNISTDAFIAMIFGISLGLSEKIIGSNLTKRANAVFEKS